MAWPTITIGNWDMFDVKARIAGLLTANFVPSRPRATKLFFRGQADASWGLTPSLTRKLPQGSMTEEEIGGLQDSAKDYFYRHTDQLTPAEKAVISNLSNKGIEWVGLMQHYGVPTTLLDWSFSPYIAAYFAVASFRDREADGAVWFFDELYVEPQLNMHMYDTAIINKSKLLDESLMQYASIKNNYAHPRIVAQQGLFTRYKDITKDFDVALDTCLANLVQAKADEQGKLTGEVISLHSLEEHYGKIIIPAAVKPEIRRELASRKNISTRTVYPGLEGLGHETAEFIQWKLATPPTA
jgi:FRG domain